VLSESDNESCSDFEPKIVRKVKPCAIICVVAQKVGVSSNKTVMIKLTFIQLGRD
jgi:hypothetical protein